MTADAEWPLHEIGSLLSGIIDYRGKTPPKSSSGIPLISAANVKNGRVLLDDAEFIGPDEYVGWARRGFTQPGDVLITTEAPAGEVAPYPSEGTYQISRRVMALRPDPSRLDSRFLLYALLSKPVQQKLLSYSRGTTVPRVLKTDVTGLQIRLPSLQLQSAIARILGTLDDKIELNRRMNDTLEAIARAVFKSWFVDFDPVRAKLDGRAPHGMDADTAALFPERFEHVDGELVPAGWRLRELGNIASLQNKSIKPNQAPDKVWEHYSIPAFDASRRPSYDRGESIKSGKYAVPPECVPVSKLNPDTPRVWRPDPEEWSSAVCSTEFLPFVSKASINRAYLYELLRSDDMALAIAERATGSTGSRQRVRPADVASIAAIEPEVAVAGAFAEHVEPLHELAASNLRESQTLAELRDTLLPKLLSGELSVPAAEEAVEEVA